MGPDQNRYAVSFQSFISGPSREFRTKVATSRATSQTVRGDNRSKRAHCAQCIKVWTTTQLPLQFWVHQFVHSLGQIPTTWYVHEEIRRHDANAPPRTHLLHQDLLFLRPEELKYSSIPRRDFPTPTGLFLMTSLLQIGRSDLARSRVLKTPDRVSQNPEP
jgi:hypothetical protein